MKNKIKIILLTLFITSQLGFSQEKEVPSLLEGVTLKNSETIKSPIPIQTMFGNEKINYLSIFNFRLGEHSRFGYFGEMTLSIPYQNNDGFNELVFSNAITYRLNNKLFVTSALQYHFLKGIVPYSVFQFQSANPKWLFVIRPSIAFLQNTSFQSVSIVEYKPKLSKS